MNRADTSPQKRRNKFRPIHLLWVGVVIVILLVCSPLLLGLMGFPVGAAGLGDWRFHGLPGNWEVWRLNSRQIKILYVKPGIYIRSSSVVEDYVSYVAWTEDFIFAQQVTLPEEWETRDGVDGLAPAYYIVDVKTRLTHGPYDSEADFLAACEELNTGPLPDWVRTTELPDKDYGS